MQVSAVNATSSITPTNDVAARATSAKADQPAEASPFGDVMVRFLEEINGQQLQAEKSVQQFTAGETDSVGEVVLSVAKADLSFRLLMEIRNRLISSYQEIQRMQV